MKTIFDPALLSALEGADSFMVCTHIRPDGDAISSMLAAGRLLRAMGKKVTLVCQDAVPEKYDRFFEDAKGVITPDQAKDMHFDAALAVDVADAERMGSAYTLFQNAAVTLQIDHHISNPAYAMHNAINGKASATGEMIVQLYDALNIPMDAEAAAQLYAAISTDSGNFTFNSVCAETFAAMQRLMESGLDISDINRRLFKVRKRQQVKMLSHALDKLTFFADGQGSYMFVTKEEIAMEDAQPEHLNAIVNYGLDIEGVCMTFMGDENPDGSWKISMRAVPGYDVSQIALQFGGGGHKLAAGCTMKMTFDEAKEKLMSAMLDQLRK
ncbi:MAG: bifunctional oligoribonuclease/PAP phosphatase NrnA [Clostridia bacterium]|nr:bifunctional oligoribonuclease/PAP phosphatase NrnA [Clostridia bacterium]